MNQLQGFVFLLLVALSAWLPASSYASFASTTGYLWNSGSGAYTYSTPEAGCAAAASTWGGGWTLDHTDVQAPPTRSACIGKNGTTIAGQGYAYPNSGAATCPANSTLSGSSCTCSSAYQEDAAHTSCVLSPTPTCQGLTGKSGGPITAPYVAGASMNGGPYSNLCDPGTASNPLNCSMTVSYEMAVGGIKYGQATYGGTSCVPGAGDGSSTASAPTSASSAPSGAQANPCPASSVYGTINGVQGCSPIGDRNVMMSGGTGTASAPAGSASAPESGIAGAPPGTVSVKVDITCSGGSCTTTKTFGSSTGATTGTAVSTQSKGQFCEENKSAPNCATGTGTDAGLAAAPSLYTPKYPDGIAGVWTAKKPALMATPLLGLTSSILPTVAAGLAPPSFSMPVSILGFDFGVYDVGLPQYVWSFLRWCVIISSLFLARALIFGG